MRYVSIKNCDIQHGPGCRVTLQLADNTSMHCNGDSCSIEHADEFTDEEFEFIISTLGRPFIIGLTIYGGEPFAPENMAQLSELLYAARHTYGSEKSLWVHTNYQYGDLMTRDTETKESIKLLDILVDGPYIEDEADSKLQYCESRNQRIIDVKQTLKTGDIISHDQYDFNKIIT